MKRIAAFSEEQIVSRSYPSCRTVRLQHSGDTPLLPLRVSVMGVGSFSCTTPYARTAEVVPGLVD